MIEPLGHRSISSTMALLTDLAGLRETSTRLDHLLTHANMAALFLDPEMSSRVI
jgi:hypothetical protein